MSSKVLVSLFMLFSLLAACNLPAGQPPITQPSENEPVAFDANAVGVGTAVELTSIARLNEAAGPPPSTGTPVPTFTPLPTQCSPLVTSTVNANVRLGPGTAYDVVGALPVGQSAGIVGRNDAYTWWYISYPSTGSYAWIAGSVVTAACVPAVVQIVAAPPLPTAVVVVDNSSHDTGEEETGSGVSGSGSDGGGVGESLLVLPDLAANGMQASPNPATKGEHIHVQVRVTNRGNATANNFTVQWWSSPVRVACDWTVASLAAHASKALSCTYVYSSWATYPIKLVVDSGNSVTEANETNNTEQGSLRVNNAP